MNRKTVLKIVLPALALAVAMVAYPLINETMRLPDEVRAHPLFAVYEQNFEYKALMGGVCDLDGDGREDIIVVYALSREQNQVVVILDGDPPRVTGPDRAPLENVTIEFKDIDKTPPMEFILTGSKAGQVGYAICRIQDGEIYSLFDADMDHCC